jgi:tight adherence protein C
MSIAAGSGAPALPLLLFGVALGFAGVGLIWYSSRMRHEAVAIRMELVRNKFSVRSGSSSASAASFTRGEIHGVSVERHRAAMRLFGRLGVPPPRAMLALLVSKLLMIFLIAVLIYVATGRNHAFARSFPLHMLISFGFGVAGWFVPEMLVGHQVKARAKAIVSGLPDAIELLVICVEAGLSFEDGVDRIVVELRQSQPELAEELALTSADLKILPSRDLALANLYERVEMPSIKSVVTTLTQTMRYGTPLAHALRSVAAELRNDVILKMEERANELPTLMTIPMIIFLLPTVFLIVGGPAALQLIDAFKQ